MADLSTTTDFEPSEERKELRFRQLKEIWRRMAKNKPAMFGLFILVVFVLLALFADVIADYDTVVIKQNVDTYFPASKLTWLTRNNPAVAAELKSGSALIGTIDT